MPSDVSILETDCANYYTDELEMAVEDLERKYIIPTI
jgi:hypothetical protein